MSRPEGCAGSEGDSQGMPSSGGGQVRRNGYTDGRTLAGPLRWCLLGCGHWSGKEISMELAEAAKRGRHDERIGDNE